MDAVSPAALGENREGVRYPGQVVRRYDGFRMRMGRKFPIGAELMAGDGVDFRVWAPRCSSAAVELYRASGQQPAVEPTPQRIGPRQQRHHSQRRA